MAKREKKVKKEKKFLSYVIKVTVISLAVIIIGLTAGELAVNINIKKLPTKPQESLDTNLVHSLLYYLEYPEKASEDNIVIDNKYIIDALTPVKEHAAARYDCADFQMPTLIRLQYKYINVINQISPEGAEIIKDIFINARYWLTEPGEDSACYWSENHQILFASSQYLAGCVWPDEIFTNDGKPGREHMKRAESRINYWMEHRFYYGFAEFNSTNYMPFNLAPMANIIEFSKDAQMAERMKMVMDLALYDVAANMFNFTFTAPTGRAYVQNMLGTTGDSMKRFTEYIWGLNDNWKDSSHRMLLNFVSMIEGADEQGEKFYEIPEIIKDIALDTNDAVIKNSTGLDVSELKEKGFIGHDDEQIMMQLGMEAFTNPDLLYNTITYFAKNNLFSNSFLNDFKYFNLTILKALRLYKPISAGLNPMPNGIAIQRANIYTYQTANYQLATAQAYHPGSYGATQMLSVANFTKDAVVFTVHPAKAESKKSVEDFPGYWAGFGRAPHAVQHENIQLSIYQIPKKRGFLELYDVPQFTHTYLPEAFFDDVIIDGKYAFARVGNAFLSLQGANDLEYLPYDPDSPAVFKNGLDAFPDKRYDLVQRGNNQFWIYELSDSQKESFEDFMQRIKSNSVTFDGKDNLSYTSSGNTLSLRYKGDFKINGAVEDLNYMRFDSPYITAEREADVFNFSYNGHTLTIDYKNAQRSYN